MNLTGDWIAAILRANLGALTGFVLFIALAVVEMVRPARANAAPIGPRWAGNITLYAIRLALSSLPFVTAYLAAIAATAERVGVLNALMAPGLARLVVALLAVDAATYATHRLSHAVPPLWRLHAVHHSDPDMDVSTTYRHHPLEVVVAALFNALIAIGIGVGPDEMAVYVILATAVQLLAHANVSLPSRAQSVIGSIFVTPRFHALHHSPARRETDSNYGEVFSFWDRLFRTATTPDTSSGRGEVFGLETWRDDRHQLPHMVLAQPFLSLGARPGV